MIKKDYICQVILKAEICVSDFTAMEIDRITFGHDGREDLKANIDYINTVISILSGYIPQPIINSGKVNFSSKGRFVINGISLSLTPKKYKVRPDDVNCLTEDQICSLINKLLLICPNC